MPFKYCCFISYRAGRGKFAEGIIQDLYEALSDEMELMLEEDVSSVYLDKKRLKGGDFFDQELANSLCQSVCMIAVFTPTYFSKSQPYCAQEYKAMESLEEQRLKLLPSGKSKGLIIPVVIRGEDRLPLTIKKKRTYYDFSAFQQGNRRLTRPRGYFEGIKAIADYVSQRYWELSGLGNDPCVSCRNFTFPDKDETQKWLDGILDSSVEKAR
jgi:hypothetical protein